MKMNKEMIKQLVDAQNTLEMGKESLHESADELELGDSVLMLVMSDDTMSVTKIAMDEETEQGMLMAYLMDSLEKKMGDDLGELLEGLMDNE